MQILWPCGSVLEVEAMLMAICLSTGSDILECNSLNRYSLSENWVLKRILQLKRK
jgi:hypothetical protein